MSSLGLNSTISARIELAAERVDQRDTRVREAARLSMRDTRRERGIESSRSSET